MDTDDDTWFDGEMSSDGLHEVFDFFKGVYKLASIVLPPTVNIANNNVLPTITASRCMHEKYSIFLSKMKTLCAVRDDLKCRSNHYTSKELRTMDDWFDRVNNFEEAAKQQEIRFTKKQESINVYSRAKFSTKMAELSEEIVELEKEGNRLRDTMVLKKIYKVYICIAVLLFSSLFVLLISAICMKISPLIVF